MTVEILNEDQKEIVYRLYNGNFYFVLIVMIIILNRIKDLICLDILHHNNQKALTTSYIRIY